MCEMVYKLAAGSTCARIYSNKESLVVNYFKASKPWVMITCKIKYPRIRNKNHRMSLDIHTHKHTHTLPVIGELYSEC